MSYDVLGVPATSVPVERVFSHGGLIMRPHWACMTDGTLTQLIFLCCNQRILIAVEYLHGNKCANTISSNCGFACRSQFTSCALQYQWLDTWLRLQKFPPVKTWLDFSLQQFASACHSTWLNTPNTRISHFTRLLKMTTFPTSGICGWSQKLSTQKFLCSIDCLYTSGKKGKKYFWKSLSETKAQTLCSQSFSFHSTTLRVCNMICNIF